MPDIQANVPTPATRVVSVPVEVPGDTSPVLIWPSKDPDEVLDYALDWTQRLTDDTIEKSEWVERGQLIIYMHWWDNTHTRLWLKGGVAGTTYFTTNRIMTAAGRWMDQTVKITILKSR